MFNGSIGSTATAQLSVTNAAAPTGVGVVASELGAMDNAMATVARHAQFDRPGDAKAVLATGDDYVSAGRRAIASLDDQLVTRSERLQQAARAGAPEHELVEEREQLQLMTILRDRIAQSIERVQDILRESIERDAEDSRELRRARDSQVLLGGYDALRAQLVVMPGVRQVASTYSQR